MGRYVNPGNEEFARIVEAEYVDKTGLISLFDHTLNSAQGLVMVSRPRRFGKSFAAKSLVAFYSCGCDSRALFEGLNVSKREGWDAHLNQYNVVSLDMTKVIQEDPAADFAQTATALVLGELRDIVPNAGAAAVGPGGVLTDALLDVVEATGRTFVFVIDEWDAPYRLAKEDSAAQDSYADWLRNLFKNGNFTGSAIAGAYLTGILPIKKYAHQSAVSDFDEYTMLSPAKYAPYVGFTGDEVAALCEEYAMDLDEMRRWYDGYRLRYREDRGTDASPRFSEVVLEAYAPYSLMRACQRGSVGSYWPTTETFESLRQYIDMDFDGLQGAIARAVAGEGVSVDTLKFQNDLVSMRDADDVLTLLIHLGYLYYDEESSLAHVPNEEVRNELARAIVNSSHPKLMDIMAKSARLLEDVVSKRERAVARRIQEVHDEEASPLFYNNEQALRAVVKSAFIAAVDEYARIEELPGGKGYADVAYLPRRGSALPALLVELKWDKSADAAIQQARERNYPQALRELGAPVVLVGITYDAKTKEHACRIEELDER